MCRSLTVGQFWSLPYLFPPTRPPCLLSSAQPCFPLSSPAMRPRPTHGRSRSLSDPLSRALLPPEDESPYERDSRLQRVERAKRVNDAIDEQIRIDKAELRRQKNLIKVLLLGQSESGKSTTLKRPSSLSLFVFSSVSD